MQINFFLVIINESLKRFLFVLNKKKEFLKKDKPIRNHLVEACNQVGQLPLPLCLKEAVGM